MNHSLYIVYHIVDQETCHLVYGGLTSKCVLKRFNEHLQEASYCFKPKDDYFILHRDELRVALYATHEELEKVYAGEIELIAWLRATEDFNLNSSSGGGHGSLGAKWNAEQRSLLKNARSTAEARASNSASQKEAQNRPAVRAKKISTMNKPEVVARKSASAAANALIRFGKLYPGSPFERIKGITPSKSTVIPTYRIEVGPASKRVTKSNNWAHPLDAVESLHKLQASMGLPLSTIPESYSTQRTQP